MKTFIKGYGPISVAAAAIWLVLFVITKLNFRSKNAIFFFEYENYVIGKPSSLLIEVSGVFQFQSVF